jgi:hypothetical protein
MLCVLRVLCGWYSVNEETLPTATLAGSFASFAFRVYLLQSTSCQGTDFAQTLPGKLLGKRKVKNGTFYLE